MNQISLFLGVLQCFLGSQVSQENPVIHSSRPLALVAGYQGPMILRGLKLDKIQRVELRRENHETVSLAIKSKALSAPPNGQDPKKLGDSQLDLDLKLSGDLAVGTWSLVVIGETGESSPRPLEIHSESTATLEKEPNEGNDRVQDLSLGVLLIGQIEQQRDVDVFRVDVSPDRNYRVSVLASQLGAAIDPLILISNGRGQILATCDDVDENLDPLVEFRSGAENEIRVTVIDAHDQGGPAHGYLLEIQEIEP